MCIQDECFKQLSFFLRSFWLAINCDVYGIFEFNSCKSLYIVDDDKIEVKVKFRV